MRELVNGVAGAGEHGAAWDGRDAAGHVMPSGLYILRLEAEGLLFTVRVVAIR